MTDPTARDVRDIGKLVDKVGEYIGLTHDAPWPVERQAARDALAELGRLAFASHAVEEARRDERERCARVAWKRADDLAHEPRPEYEDHAQFKNGREHEAAAICQALLSLPDAPERDGERTHG